MMDEESEDYGEEGNDEFAALASEAFPDQEFDAPRLSALKQLIKLCMGGGEEDEEAEPKSDKAPNLAIVFGGKPKKK